MIASDNCRHVDLRSDHQYVGNWTCKMEMPTSLEKRFNISITLLNKY